MLLENWGLAMNEDIVNTLGTLALLLWALVLISLWFWSWDTTAMILWCCISMFILSNGVLNASR